MAPRNRDKEISTEVASPDGAEKKMSVVEASAMMLTEQHKMITFRNRLMWLSRDGYPHFIPLSKELFDRVGYPMFGGVSRSRMSDIFAFLPAVVEDFTANEDLVLFGLEDWSDGAYADNGYYHKDAKTAVWDASTLDWSETSPAGAVWRSPYAPIPATKPIKFIMDLANNDVGLYDDIMQSIAPMVMTRKPDGVIWWVGDGANGKSTLMDALYRIFPGQLASLTVKTLTEGRDTPFLNGNLANIVKESSEGRVEDTEIYKAIGTHENFTTHKFHSQDTITVRGNMHHIFSANTVPTFNDKGYSARRRTFIVPFTARFESDPSFEERTFTSELFGQLIYEMCKYAKRIERQGYRYKWSAQTTAAKLEYDTDANNAEEYAREIIHQGVVAFDSFNPVKIDYENWCADNGYVPLGVTNLRRAILRSGFERLTVRFGDHTRKMYRLPVASTPGELQEFGMGRPGMYTIPGFTPPLDEAPAPPEFSTPSEPDVETEPEPEEQPKTILNGRW